MPEFWTGGRRSYRDALEREFQDRTSALRARLSAAETQAERQQLLNQIRQVETEYDEKRRGVPRMLF